MSEKPILFSTEMVQAILSGRKTQTRRVIKPQFIDSELLGSDYYFYGKSFNDNNRIDEGVSWFKTEPIPRSVIRKAKYQLGDILWARETWCEVPYESKCVQLGDSLLSMPVYAYRADSEIDYRGFWKPSIYMPREIARIFLKVTDVKVERLQDISEADAKAEGVRSYFRHKEHGGEWHESNCSFVGANNTHSTRKEAFAELWDSINVKRGYGWDVNPWVWVYTFERTEM